MSSPDVRLPHSCASPLLLRPRVPASLRRFLRTILKVLDASPSIRSDASSNRIGDTHVFHTRARARARARTGNDRKVRFSRPAHVALIVPEAADWLETTHPGNERITPDRRARTGRSYTPARHAVLVSKKKFEKAPTNVTINVKSSLLMNADLSK